jgi:hypothetical protein
MELVQTAIAWWEGKVERRRAPNQLKKQASLSASMRYSLVVRAPDF